MSSNWWEEAPLANEVPAYVGESIKTDDDAWWAEAPVVDAPVAKPAELSWLETGKDTVVQLAEGVNTIAGAVPNLIAPDSGVAGFFRENADSWRAQQSPAMLQKVANADAQIAAADQDSIVDQVVAAAKAYSSDPALAARFVVTNLPSMVPGIGAAKLAQAAKLARGASAAAAAATATTAAGGVNAVLNAGGARGEAFEDVRDTLIAQGRSPEEAERIALDKSLLPAAVGGVTGFLSGKVGLEKALVNGGVARGGIGAGLRSAGAEILGEQAEELLPQVATNYQAGEFDQRPLSRNIGRTAVETAIASGPSSAVAGVMTGRSTIASERARLEAMRAARVEAEAAVAAQRDQAVADIGAQDSVDGAIAAAGRAVNLDSDQLLADALGSVGIDLSELRQADAADAAAQAAPAAEGAPAVPATVNQTVLPGGLEVPVRTWSGRRGDGYAAPEDAERGLKERMRLQPNLDWRVEPTPDGKYRLAGYAQPSGTSSQSAELLQRLQDIAENGAGEPRKNALEMLAAFSSGAMPAHVAQFMEREARALVSVTPTPTQISSGQAGLAAAVAPGRPDVLTAQQKQEIARARAQSVQAPSPLDDVVNMVRSGTDYTSQGRVRDTQEAVEDAWLALNADVQGSVSAAPSDANSAATPLIDREAIGQIDAKVRSRRIQGGLQNILDADVSSGVQIISYLNDSLRRIGEAPLGDRERGAALRVANAYFGFRGTSERAPLPSSQEKIRDTGADNSSMEALIPQRGVPRATAHRPASPRAAQAVAPAEPAQAAINIAADMAPVRLGRNNSALSEGGKPFATRKAAGEAKRLQPMMRVVSVQGGYALAEKTLAQLAAEQKAAMRLSTPRTSARGEPIPAHAFIAAAGGLNAGAATDLGVDGNPRIGNRRLFAGRGRGLSMEQATGMLMEDGYLSEGATLNDAFALIKLSLTRPQYNADGIERIAEAEMDTRFSDYMAAQDDAMESGEYDPFDLPADFTIEDLEEVGYTQADPALQAEVNALMAQVQATGLDPVDILEDIVRTYANATQDEYNAAALQAITAAITRSSQDGGSTTSEAPPTRAGAENNAIEGLTSYAPADIQAQQARQERAAKAEAAAKRAEDAAATEADNRKRIAAASVAAADSFELGQDPMDSLTGQKDVFADAQPAQESKQKPPPAQSQQAQAATESVAPTNLKEGIAAARAKKKANTGAQPAVDAEASTKLPPFPVDGYRLEGYYANGAKVKPLPAKAFSPTEVQAITDWFKSIGWRVTSGSGANGVNTTNDVGMTVDDLPEPYTAAQRKKDEAQKAADERAADKQKAQDDYLASNDAGKFVSDMFGDSMNRFNLTALAKVLAGDEKTFGGLFSNRAADVLADAGISTEGRQVKDVVADIKATFDVAQQEAKNPAKAAADVFADAPQQQAATETAADKPPAKRKLPPKLAAKAAEVEAQRAAYFAPGNIVVTYSGYDRVISYTPADAQGNWSVTVQPVEQQGDKWVDVPNSKPRTHSTQPYARAMRAGPVVVAKAKATIDDAALNSSPIQRDSNGRAERRAPLIGKDRWPDIGKNGFASPVETEGQQRVVDYMNGDIARSELLAYLESTDLEPAVMQMLTMRMQGDALMQKETDAMMQRRNAAADSGADAQGNGVMFSRASAADQTQTEAFKKWFGDSKVVDAQGNPLVMYHGTTADFDAFDNSKTGANDRGLWGRGHYFASSPTSANSYALRQGDGARVIPAYISIQNPLVLRTGSDLVTRLPDGTNTRELIGTNLDGAKIKAIALDGGHDGVVQIKPDGSIGDVVAFEPAQIKSAIGNNGDFDPANPDIRYSNEMSPELARAIMAAQPAPATKESVRAAVRELVNGLGLLPNRLGRVVVATAAEIKQEWEPLIGPTGMEASGGVGKAQGFYDPKSKTVFLIADHIKAGDELGVAAHELMHKHGPAVLGQENWDKLHSAIGGWAKAKAGSMERIVYDEAARRVQASGPELSTQELFPYAVQVALEMGVRPNALVPQGTVARWLGQVRAALRTVWEKITHKPDSFKSQDLVNLAFGIAQRENPAYAGGLDGVLEQGDATDAGQSGGVQFSRAAAAPGAGFSLPTETFFMKKRRRMQDYFIRVQQVQQAVLEQNGVIDEQTDTYRAEELSHGRATALLMDFAQNQVEPFMQKMHKAGVELEELSLYAYAMHAPERNAQIARIDAQLQDGGSGMTNADAQAVIDQARQDGTLAQLQELHTDLMGIVRQNRVTMLSEGLITQKEFDALEGAYQNYIPLRGFEGVDESGKHTGVSAGKGFNIRGPETLRAKGRTSRAGLLIENALADYQRTLVRAERNQVAKVFLNFVMKNPDPALWEIDATTTRKSLDRQTGRIARSTEIDKGEDTIAVKVNGVEVYIRIKDELLLRALRKSHSDDTGETERFLMRSVGLYTTLLRNTLTRYNPEFAVVNAVRDFGFGSMAVLDELGERGVVKFAAHYAGATAASFRHERNTLDPQARDWDKWFTEYKAAGGMTAGFYAKGAEDVAKDIRQVLLTAGAKPRNLAERVSSSSPARAAKAALRLLEISGATSENAARVAAYRTAREMGKTPAQAASIAKNLTTNFDRKGELGQLTNAFYVFFNAAVQGTHRALKMFANKKVMGYMAGLTAASVGIALASALQGGDDPDDGMAYWDKIPDYVKERNFIIMLPPGAQIEGAEEVGSKGRYVAIPVQYGLNIFHLTGYQIADVLRNQRDKSRGVDLTKAGINLASAVAGSFNPFGGGVDLSNGSSIAQAIAPSLMDPVIQLATGTNGFGRNVAPFKSSFDTSPDSDNVNVRQEGGAAHRVAQWINAATGGDEHESGRVDLSPGTLENVVRNLTGGAGMFIYDALSLSGKSAEMALGGDPDVFVRDVPFLRKVYGETAGDVDQGLFYERRQAIGEARGIQKRRADAGLEMADAKKEAQAETGKDAAKFSKWLSEVRKEMVEVKKDTEMTEVEKRTRMRELRAERDTLTSEFNKAWMETMKEWAADQQND